MIRKEVCIHCGEDTEVDVSKNLFVDNLGWYTVCKKCECSFDVDIYDYLYPNGTVVLVDGVEYVVMGNDVANTEDCFANINYYIVEKDKVGNTWTRYYTTIREGDSNHKATGEKITLLE